MTKRTAAALSLLVATGCALSAECSTREYAQYKDMIKGQGGPQRAALLYCLNRNLSEIDPLSAGNSACRREMSKIMDALDSAKAQKAVDYALRQCK